MDCINNDMAEMEHHGGEEQADYFTQEEEHNIMDIDISEHDETNNTTSATEVDYAFALMVVPNELHTPFLEEMRRNNISEESALLQSRHWAKRDHKPQPSL